MPKFTTLSVSSNAGGNAYLPTDYATDKKRVISAVATNAATYIVHVYRISNNGRYGVHVTDDVSNANVGNASIELLVCYCE